MNAASIKVNLPLATLLSLFALAPMTQVLRADPAPVPGSRTGPVVSEHMRPVLKRAQDAVNGRNYELALKELDVADAMQQKSSFDQTVIDRLRTYAKEQLSKQQQ